MVCVGALLSSFAEASVADRADACKSLAAADFSTLADAPTQVLDASEVAATPESPTYCQVKGYVSPNVAFLIRLPSRWNGKLIEVGCGGFCGRTDHITMCDDPLRRGYACIVSDSGHQSTARDAKWAYNNIEAQIDLGYRGAHVTALAGKAVSERYYGELPRKSYFSGCSTGGRQGLMEAQRFPWDFDGIIAGAPGQDDPEVAMDMLWANRALVDSKGVSVLSAADLALLHAAVVRECDMNDGIKDGLIGDPRVCKFDPAQLLCTRSSHTQCLTRAQLDAVTKLYDGPKTSKGVSVYSPGPMKGSELTWLNYFRGPAGNPRQMYNFAGDEFRYIAFWPAPGPRWAPEEFDFDRDYQRLGMTAALYSADNPDLRKFKSRGGKLLSYAGWSDAVAVPESTIDYYETVERTMGGRTTTQEFFRLFMVPGMNHCTGGEGAFAVDYLTYMENWVEKGAAPDVMLAAHVPTHKEGYDGFGLKFPLDPTIPVSFSRPVYPYPLRAKYKGAGEASDAGSFGPVEP
jgi:hypothetical protein